MNALWWWIDRWRRSSAFVDLTLEQQGAYRNLLDEATLRGGALPNDDRILARACGDPYRWRWVKSAVMSRFVLKEDGFHHPTLDAVLDESNRRSAKQKAYRAKSVTKNVTGRVTVTKPTSQYSSLSVPIPIVPSLKAKRHRSGLNGSNCSHTPRCRSSAECIDKALHWEDS